MSILSRNILFTLFFIIAAQYSSAQENCLTENLEFGNVTEAVCLNEIGQELLIRGRTEQAIEAFEKALSESVDPEVKITSYNQLAVAYKNLGIEQQASNYILRAVGESENSDSKMIKAATYNNYGLVMTNVDNNMALDNYLLALQLYQEIYDTEHSSILQSLVNIGIVYRNLEFYGDAIYNFEEAKKIADVLYTEPHASKGFIDYNLAQTYYELNTPVFATQFFESALQQYQAVYGEKHPDIARVYNRLGNIVNQNGEFEEALAYYQKALIANSRGFTTQDLEYNPKVSEYINSNTLLNSLFYKAQAFEDYHFNFSLDFKDLKKGLSTLYSADSLIDIIRKTITTETDKIAVGSLATQVYENGVRLSYSMADLGLKKDEYYEHAFYFTEKSKSAVLLQSISDASAKSYANIPLDQIEMESFYQKEINYYEQQIAKKETENSKTYIAELLSLRRDYRQFVANLEMMYPEYYNLKYNVEIPTISKIQERLKEDQALISYFNSDMYLYVFLITNSKLKVDRVKKSDDFDRYLSGFRNSIYFKSDEIYKLTATGLYEELFPSSIPKSIEHLTIIPSGTLGTLPFEALLTDKVKENELNYSELPYLVNSYSVSYQYAAALFYQNKIRNSANNKQSALLCAPINFEFMEDLPGTAAEISELENIFTSLGLTTDVMVKREATESSLKGRDLNAYKYLHLATHGLVNEYIPALSRIYLYQESEGTEDGSLYSGEIYNLKLNAELVTLSACETGLGRISKGEGIIGLSRALIYAGAENLVVSFWKVADESTATLMTNFYSDITTNSYSTSLQNAKKAMIKSKNAHPYLWAPFVLIGN